MKNFSAHEGMEEDEFFSKLTEMFDFFNKRVRNVGLGEKESCLIFYLFIKLRRGMEPKKNIGNQRKRTQKERYENLYRRCRDAINGILRKHNYEPVVPCKVASKSGLRHIPAEIKVLVYYMAYRAIELYDHAKEKKSLKKPTQKGLLEFIGNPVIVNGKKTYQGYRFSNKTFTNFGISPSVFYDINNYKQIELPTSYAGAKVGYLGYCINYLVAFAGTVDCVVDLFGGSGSATMALFQQDTVEYYMNELDFFVSNYHRVLNDPALYGGFIKKVEKVIERLTKKDFDVELGKDFFCAREKKQKKWERRYPVDRSDIFSQSGVVLSKNVQRWKKDAARKKKDAAAAYAYLQCFQTTGGRIAVGAVSQSKLARFCRYGKEKYDPSHAKFKRLDGIYCADVLNQNNAMSIIEYFTDKAPNKFKVVEQVSKDIRSGVSVVQAMKNIGDDERKKAMGLLRLLGYTEKKPPRPFRTLFYSDSPYLGTSGYGAGGISGQTMKYLIEKLTDASKKGSHFIFSCRATRSVEHRIYNCITETVALMENFRRNKEGEVCLELNKEYEDAEEWDRKKYAFRCFKAQNAMRNILRLLKSNQSIYEDLFKVFLEQTKKKEMKCYVLVCINNKAIESANFQYERDNKELVTTVDGKVEVMLQRLFVTEIFITDFDFIAPLDYDKYSFAKYTLEDFCDLLKKYLFRSSMYGNTVVRKQGNGYIFKQESEK